MSDHEESDMYDEVESDDSNDSDYQPTPEKLQVPVMCNGDDDESVGSLPPTLSSPKVPKVPQPTMSPKASPKVVSSLSTLPGAGPWAKSPAGALPKPSPARRHTRAPSPAPKEAADVYDVFTATDAPLPLPGVCVQYEQALSEPERVAKALEVFEDPFKYMFDATDVQNAEAILERAKERADAAEKEGVDIDVVVAKTANLVRMCNERWKLILKMVQNDDLRPADELMNYLTTRQFAMRREIVNAIRELGDAYV